MDIITHILNYVFLGFFVFSIVNVFREILLFILSLFRNDEIQNAETGGKYIIPKSRLIMLGITLSYFITFLFIGTL